MKFATVLDRDEDGIWVAECPSIPGCISQGKTREALKNIKETIALCLEVRDVRARKLAQLALIPAQGRKNPERCESH